MTNSVSINGRFSQSEIEVLRKEYGKIQTVNPTSPAMVKLNNWIGSLTDESLIMLKEAKIKWISSKCITESILRKRGRSLKNK